MLQFFNQTLLQRSEQIDGKSYKNAKIKLISGKNFEFENITVTDSELNLIYKKDSVSEILEKFPLSDVEYIKVAKMSYLPLGVLVGAVLAFGVVETIRKYRGEVVTEYQMQCTYEYPPGGGRREHCVGPNITKTTWITPSTEQQLAIYTVGVALGASIGYNFKDWKQIYPIEETNDKTKVSIGLPLLNNYFDTQVLSVQFRF